MVFSIIATIENEDDKTFMLNLFNQYHRLIYKTVLNITHDPESAEDLINDTVVKLIEKMTIIRLLNEYKLAAYIVYTAKSVSINFIRHRDVQRKYIYMGSESDLSEDLFVYEDSLDECFIQKKELESLRIAITKLPENQKDLLYYKYFLNMNDEEIAKNIGITTASVRQYLTRARREAKKLMAKEMSSHAE